MKRYHLLSLVLVLVLVLILTAYSFVTIANKIATSLPATITDKLLPITTTSITGINSNTGVYKNYFLGLVEEPGGVLVNSYDDFVVLINNRKAKNPTYQQLLDFLRSDETDKYPYQDVNIPMGSYFGSAESHVDLNSIMLIIDGIEEAKPPRLCSDFAENLHNNAEMAGIRAGYVSLDLTGSNFGHACNIFETIDRGIIYIDDTGDIMGDGPQYNDAIIDVVEVGKYYNPNYLFPSGGWYIPSEQMGIVAGIYIIWDGNWNN
ncbi:hypothetical protein ACFLYB_05320 [Chloroflexota bacterium]